jgi:hypothetical protein
MGCDCMRRGAALPLGWHGANSYVVEQHHLSFSCTNYLMIVSPTERSTLGRELAISRTCRCVLYTLTHTQR